MPTSNTPRIGVFDIGYGHMKAIPPGVKHPLLVTAAVSQEKHAGLPSSVERDAIPVVVDGKPYWVGEDAAISLGEQMARKPRHSDYIQTQEYRALLYAALSLMDTDTLDIVVTGLPVEHFQHQHATLRKMLIGTHTIRPGHTVTIRDAYVIPQPMGGMLNYLSTTEDSHRASQSTVLVYDPGYGTFDWVLFESMRPVGDVSGSSRYGFGQILDLISDQCAEQFSGSRPARPLLERAVREGKERIWVGPHEVPLQPAIEKAAAEIAPLAVGEMKNILDDRLSTMTLIIGVGGGAPAYRDAVQAMFPAVPVEVPESPVFDIVHGYKIYARSQLAKHNKAAVGE